MPLTLPELRGLKETLFITSAEKPNRSLEGKEATQSSSSSTAEQQRQSLKKEEEEKQEPAAVAVVAAAAAARPPKDKDSRRFVFYRLLL